MKISLIAAMDLNRVIGKDNDIPWRIPEDWKHVQRVTNGHPIILGRKNLESIGRALPNRRNIVMTRDHNYQFDGCEIVHSIEEVFEAVKGEDEIFIFGGEEIYKMFMPYVTKMYITCIHHEFEGDTFFPEFNMSEWKGLAGKKGIKDDKNPYDYYFHVYERKSPYTPQI